MELQNSIKLREGTGTLNLDHYKRDATNVQNSTAVPLEGAQNREPRGDGGQFAYA